MGKMNKWKTLFFILFSFNLAIIVIIGLFIFLPADSQKKENIEIDEAEQEIVFPIKTSKSDLNKVINHYLEKEKSPIHYQVVLRDQVELYGTVKVFTQDVEMKVFFEPEALENGDLLLKNPSISIGRLQLPVPYVLKFVRDQYDIPEWVNIIPDEEYVYVSLHEMNLKNDLKVRVNKFDLRNDDLRFSLVIPMDR